MYHTHSHIELEVWSGAAEGERRTIPRSRLWEHALIAIPQDEYRDHRSGAFVVEKEQRTVDVFRVIVRAGMFYLEHVEDRVLPARARDRSEV